jgi:hypothetical protein
MFLISMSDGMRLSKQGRYDVVDRMTSVARPFHDLMRRLIGERHLRDVGPELLTMQFLGPLLMWRNLRAAGSQEPLLNDRAGFARDHVDQFLRGAAVGTSDSPQPVKETGSRRPVRSRMKLVR